MKKNYGQKTYIKAIIILLVGIVGFVLLQSVPYVIKRFGQKENNIYIQYNQLINMLNDREKEFFLIISKEGCPSCEDLEGQLADKSDIVEKNAFYTFKYRKKDSQVVASALGDILPDFFAVPYICYINGDNIEKYDGELDINIIFKWMEERKTTYD